LNKNMPQLFSSPVGLSQLDPHPSARIAIPLSSNSGGSGGDDGNFNFPTGAEVYTFTSNSIRGPNKPKAITTMWVDASALAAGKTLTIQCSNGQRFVITAGTAGYFIVPLPAPFTLTVSTNNAAATTVVIILYNYNVAFTGFSQQGSAATAQAGGSSGTPSGGGSGGSGGSGGGGKGGGFL
jgi:hypothetical protein